MDAMIDPSGVRKNEQAFPVPFGFGL